MDNFEKWIIGLAFLAVLLITAFFLVNAGCALAPVSQEIPPVYSEYLSPEGHAMTWERIRAVDYLHCPRTGRNYFVQLIKEDGAAVVEFYK
jgi:hypothetical protein